MEYLETSAQLCKAGLLLMNRISEVRFSYITKFPIRLVDLSLSENIHTGNAIRTDWGEIIPSSELSYIIGNPPFISNPSETQKKDIESVFDGNAPVDYCACWVKKAADFIIGTDCEVGLLITNSICQGSQMPWVWRPLVENKGIKINFAYQSFDWRTDTSRRVQVSCAIVGFANFDRPQKLLYTQTASGDFVCRTVDRINCSLYPGEDIFLPFFNTLTTNLDERPVILNGKNITLPIIAPEDVEKYEEKNFSKYVTAEDMLYGRTNYIQDLMPEQSQNYIAIPRHSSEKRQYIPICFFESEQIVLNDSILYFKGEGATLTLFGLLNSSMHNTWVRRVCGRLMTRLRYSAAVYTSFPFPQMSEENKIKIAELAEQILLVRAKYSEPLAILYNNLPDDLLKAHKTLDAYIEKLYEGKIYLSDDERMKVLIERFNDNKNIEPKSLGEKLAQLRLNKSLTLVQLDKKTGIKWTNLTGYERNNKNPPIETLQKLADFYEIDVEDLTKYRKK